MTLINWKPKYSVNVKEMDTQHMKLIDMINNLYELIKNDHNKENISILIQDLINYTKVHFAKEEYYMKVHDYPGYSIQREEHMEFLGRITNLQQDFENEKILDSLENLKFLKTWIVHHIRSVDGKYSVFFNIKGIS